MAAQPNVAGFISNVMVGSNYLEVTSSIQISANPCVLAGVFVASSTSGTIKLWDNTAASGTVLVNTFSASPGTWYPLPFLCKTGLYVTIAGTIDCTFSFT